MIYLFLIAFILIYLSVLLMNRDKSKEKKSNSFPYIIILFPSLLTMLFFSLNYDHENAKKYKQIHTKNLTVRDNIQTIKQNIPKLEFKLSNSPDDFNGWLMLGKSYSILKDYQKASNAYEVAISLRPNNMDVLREYILVLRSDSEVFNKELIEKYFLVYINKTDEPQALLDLLNFSFNTNNNSLAQDTLNRIISHPDIDNKMEYEQLLTNLQGNNSETILEFMVSYENKYNGYFFMLLKEKDINQPFAIKRIKIDSNKLSVRFTSEDFMINKNIEVPDNFDFVIKHSDSDRFTEDTKPREVFRMSIDNYRKIRGEKLKVVF